MVTKPIITISFLLLSSCNLFERGYVDKNGQYVPKNPKFELKDVFSGEIPGLTDSNIVFVLDKHIYNGKADQSLTTIQTKQMDIRFYIKFYQNGRCIMFSLNADELTDESEVNLITKLDVNKPNCEKGYYTFSGNTVTTESFVYGEGNGQYIKLKYEIVDGGSKLVLTSGKNASIYIAKPIFKIPNGFYFDW